ncbi:ABC transporter permease subunit [Salinicola sp. LHM]|uniref:amino acid ABC transporter permease n=1 Tax=unclassified Salinicola TaxID=2634022 RepID=UPI0008DD0B7A|nr:MULTISPECIES: ABC transporter permease subunit [unclassified Salinicola]MED5499433.1 ABC transporter permease subunit [Pseudomonadota bacterium]OHZ02961.1 amino acid ABC transporter permease [Salinicola sp. MIT1003]WQH32897.1 ABC transporter permease subunit [Salinicola sp. LHM]
MFLTPRLHNARVLSALQQGAVLLLVAVGLYWLISEASTNLDAKGIASGFGFLKDRAGYDITFHLIDYSPDDTYFRAYLVGLLNTLLVSLMSIALATVLGVLLGVCRVSPNWLVSRLSYLLVEFLRNVPLVVHLIWWYSLTLALPGVRQAIPIFDVAFLSNRGLMLPWSSDGSLIGWGLLCVCLGGLLGYLVMGRYLARQPWKGLGPARWPAIVIGAVLIPVACYLVSSAQWQWDLPVSHGFSFRGGVALTPELLALWLALSIYSASYIAEIVRGAIQSVSRGQYEAADALGFRERKAMAKLIIPQAIYPMIPQFTSTYLNIIKNSSLGVVVGFMELVSSTGGTTLNQTGQAIECIALVMATYCVFSLVTSALMNFYNHRIGLRTH